MQFYYSSLSLHSLCRCVCMCVYTLCILLCTFSCMWHTCIYIVFYTGETYQNLLQMKSKRSVLNHKIIKLVHKAYFLKCLLNFTWFLRKMLPKW